MGDVGDRHVEGALEGVVPDLLAIEDGGAEALSAVLAAVGVDFFGALEEPLAILVEVAIVVKVVNDDFETTGAQGVKKFGSNALIP